jgi:Uma2 family endonuclease
MGMAPAAKEWTVEDLEDLPDDGHRYEVIDGELYVTPAPNLDHQEALAALHLILAPFVSRHGFGHVVFSPADVIFSPRRGLQPDLFVLPLADGRRPKKFGDVGRLILAVEVLSPSTARVDRVKKRAVYAQEGVPEYWIVDLDARVIERTRPGGAGVEVIAETLRWQPGGVEEALVIDVERYFEAVMGDAIQDLGHRES